MKVKTWQTLAEWLELLGELDEATRFLSGGFEQADEFKKAHTFYLKQSDKMRANLEIALVDNLERKGFSWACATLCFEIGLVGDIPGDAAGVVERIMHHILCHAQHAGFYELHGPLSVGDRLIWRPLDSRNRVECVVAKITPCDGETWVDLETSNGTFPNEEEVVRESCVRALPES